MTTDRCHLARLALPDFGVPDHMPLISPSLYAQRLTGLRERSFGAGHDVVVVYADREHSANLAYLSGFDPRFEEALMVIGPTGEPAILVGNECWGMAGEAPLTMRRHLFQDFSLPGQPRNRSRSLADILTEEGVTAGRRVGVVGWKTYQRPTMVDVPSYIVDELRELTGEEGAVLNATGLLIDAAEGLRVINELEQLAWFEYASCLTSEGVKRLLREMEPSMTEQEAVSLLGWNGVPLSCHLMLTTGPRASLGLLSPGDRQIEVGDPLTVAFGIWGALTCRAGFVAHGPGELPLDIEDYVDRLVVPYFGAVVEWYEALHVGQRAGVLQEIIDHRLGDTFFGIFLNPGHQHHLDEWVNSPVGPGSEIELRSGMAMQVDIIPATGTPYFTTNIEDGIVLADHSLRERFADSYPGAWERIKARREFMTSTLGIDLHPDVLPLSNMPAYLPPYLLSPDLAMTAAR